MFETNKPALVSKKSPKLFSGGDLADRLGPAFFCENSICNFAISGQGNKEHMISHVLGAAAGRLPVIVLHNNNHGIMAEIASVWTREFGSLDYAEEGPLWSCSTGEFEPFLGLEEQDIIHILKNLLEAAGYTATASFERVVKAHLTILRHMDCPYSLSGLYYLCSFEDLEEFQDNILALDCSNMEKNRIIANLGLADDKDREQFEQFRSMICQMAYEAKKSGWTSDGSVGSMSITTAIQKRAMMTLSISATKSSFLLAYLGQELQLHSDEPCLLLILDVRLENSGILPVLGDAGSDFRFGILSSNILDMISSDVDEAQRFCENFDLIVLLRHNVATTAESLSALLGSEEICKESRTSGSGKEYFAWLPGSKHKSVTYTVEEQRRVKPDQILGLMDNQAILFRTASNEIVLL